MRRYLLIASMALCGGLLQIDAASAQPAGASRAPAPTAQAQGSAANRPAGAENCGTPDEFRPCPPMPRVPFQSFPGQR